MNQMKAGSGAIAFGMALLAIGLAGAGSGTAQAKDHPVDTPARLLERMDRDLDGKLSFEEYRNAMLRRFDARDKNGDGVLDRGEYPREWVAGAEQASADGKISWTDFGASLQPTFDMFDKNRDGKLDNAELAAFASARQSNEGAKR